MASTLAGESSVTTSGPSTRAAVRGQQGDQAVGGELISRRPGRHDHHRPAPGVGQPTAGLPQFRPGRGDRPHRRRPARTTSRPGPFPPAPHGCCRRCGARPQTAQGNRGRSSFSTHDESSSSSGHKKPDAANSATHTESRMARSGARPSATARTKATCRSFSSVSATDSRTLGDDRPQVCLPPVRRRHEHPYLSRIRSAGQPVRVHERAVPAAAEHHALGGQVGQRMSDRSPAQAEPLAQLMLGGQATVRPVDAAQDLLGEQGLELVVDRDWLASRQIHIVMMHSVTAWLAGQVDPLTP